MMRGASREFVNTRLQSNNNNNNNRYDSYNNDRDRYNSQPGVGGRTYNNSNNRGQSGFQRSYSSNNSRDHPQHDHNDRGYDRGGGGGFQRNISIRDVQEKDDPMQFTYHTSGEFEGAEPEWMNDGPTSQNECIELRGFDDDIPEEEREKNGGGKGWSGEWVCRGQGDG